MRRRISTLIILAFSTTLPGCAKRQDSALSDMDTRRSATAQRRRFDEPDVDRLAGPWGVSFAINLTPDKATGIGEWSEETFMQAMRTGKHQGQPNGRDILPPMPWFNL